jgi:hypothetical protein
MTEGEIINRVDQSGIVTLDLSELIGDISFETIDLHQQLFQGLVLREKDFRTFVKDTDWEQYRDKNILLTCSSDAIIQDWAYMLVVAQLSDIVNEVVVGEVNDMERFLIKRILSKIQFSEYTDVRVVLKGCADEKIPGWVYAFMTAELKKYVKSLMYGEPCSSVPVYKKK